MDRESAPRERVGGGSSARTRPGGSSGGSREEGVERRRMRAGEDVEERAMQVVVVRDSWGR